MFDKIYSKELSNTKTINSKLAQNKIKSFSKTLFSELDETDKESKEDAEKMIDYLEKRKN